MNDTGRQSEFHIPIDQDLRENLSKKLEALKAAQDKQSQILTAAEFMLAAQEFHEVVSSTQEDSDMFGDFQSVVHHLALDDNAVARKRLELSEKSGAINKLTVVEGGNIRF